MFSMHPSKLSASETPQKTYIANRNRRINIVTIKVYANKQQVCKSFVAIRVTPSGTLEASQRKENNANVMQNTTQG